MSAEPIKGVLFDMDNTLIDWRNFSGRWGDEERQHLQNVLGFVAEAGQPLNVPFERFQRTFANLAQDAWAMARTTMRAPHIGKILLAALGKHGLQPDDVITMEACLQAYDWGAVTDVVIFPDVIPALEKMRAMKLKLGIITNAFQPMTMRDIELEHYGLLPFFPQRACRISAADVGYLKPHPAIFEHGLEQIGLPAENVIYVGDSPEADIVGAQSVGMRAVLRVNHERPPLISGLIVPDATIKSFDELLLLLQDWDAHTV